MEQEDLLKPLMAAITWLFVTLICKAVGKRFIPADKPFRDTLLDVITLAMSTQVALSLGDTPVVSSAVDFVLGLIKDNGSNTTASVIIGVIAGAIAAIFAYKKALKFAKFDEEAFAWRELSLFTMNFLVLVELVPWANDAMDKVAEYFTTPVGSFVLMTINRFFRIDF